MKLTILLALCTTLVTLAQKPTLEPQKDWSKERTQLWLDSLVKSLTQETKPAQNVNSGGYYNQNPPISDEQRIKEKNDLEIQIKNLKAKNQIEGMALLSKDIEEADMVFQGVAYQILERPLPENNGYFLLKFRVYSILKGEKKYNIGDHIYKCKNYGGYKGQMFNLSVFRNYIVKNNEIIEAISNGINNEDGKSYNWNMYCEFPTRDSLFNYLSSFKGINKDKDLGPNFIDYGVDYIENEIMKPKKITFEQYITNVRKEIALKKKLQLGLQNARTESVQTNNPAFSITDFNPKQIRGGIGEQLTITGLGFGNFYNSMLGIRFKDADKGGIGANIDLLYMKNLDAYDIFSWSDSKIVINFPSIVSAANGISTTTGVPGSGTFLLASYVGTNMVSSVTSPMAIDVKYAIINKFENDVKSRFYLAKYKNQCSPNLYTFYVDATIKNNPSILATVQKALRDWSDILKIDIKLAQDANNNILTTIGTSLSDDNKSIIFFAPFPIPFENASMITSPNNAGCSNSPLKTYIFNPDIAINLLFDWHYTTGDTKPAGKVDFYATLMHEIGHCLGVSHIIDEQQTVNELMYYGWNPSLELTVANRVSLNSGRKCGLEAAQRNLIDSKNLTLTGCSTLLSNIINFSHPRDTSGCIGTSSTKFKVTIATTLGMAFKWQRFVQSASVPGWSNRDDTPGFWAGTTTPELTVIAPVMALDGTRIRCVITMPGGCVYTTNPAFLKLFTSPPTIISSSSELFSTTSCGYLLSANVVNATYFGWSVYRVQSNFLYYDQTGLNIISTQNPFYKTWGSMPLGTTIFMKAMASNQCGITLAPNGFETKGNIYNIPVITASNLAAPNGFCSEINTLLGVSNANNYQWVYPNNTTTFGVNAGQNVPEINGGKANKYMFVSSLNLTQYRKTPWIVKSTNGCGTTSAQVAVRNWCEICSTTPLFLCSNSAREETETTEIAPNLSTKTLIYPNPTERILNIESPENIQKIVLFDIQGKEIAEYLPNEKKYVLDLQNINEGLYFVRIQTVLNTVETFKVQVNR